MTAVILQSLNNTTMAIKTIKKIVSAQVVNMGGIMIDQALPIRGIDQIDPFLLIHHGNFQTKGEKPQSKTGVGPHPHRGFAPVTFVFKGSIHHRDSIGNNQVVERGGTQWMHAGKGIVHSERPGKKVLNDEGKNEIIQFWVNTPAKHKMESPYYLPLSAEETPVIEKGGATISVVTGTFDGVKGPAKTYSPQTLLRGTTKAGASFTVDIPQHYNTLVYLLDGEMEIGGKSVGNKTMFWFNNDGEQIDIKTSKESRFIVLSGEPIGEPISTYGPFVMNTEQEIQQAIADYQSGKMGTLVEKF